MTKVKLKQNTSLAIPLILLLNDAERLLLSFRFPWLEAIAQAKNQSVSFFTKIDFDFSKVLIKSTIDFA